MFFYDHHVRDTKLAKSIAIFTTFYGQKILSNPQEAVVIGPNFMPHKNFDYCNKYN